MTPASASAGQNYACGLLTTWLRDVVDTSLEPTTRYQYHWQVDTRIVPALGALGLAELTAAHVQAWVAELFGTPSRRGGTLGRRSVEEPYTVLRRALNVAVAHRLITRIRPSALSCPGGSP